jgi:hypothetical protein
MPLGFRKIPIILYICFPFIIFAKVEQIVNHCYIKKNMFLSTKICTTYDLIQKSFSLVL